MQTVVEVGERFPKPVRRVGASALVASQRFRGRNYFDNEWDGHRFRFGYWDRVTFRRSKNVVDDGLICHERIPVEHLRLDPDASRSAVLDIGAHFGFYTVVLATLNPDLAVHAFEPHAYNARVLESNLALNGHTDRVSVHRNAVSDSSGSIAFYTDPRPEGTVSHTITPAEKHANYERTTVDTVSASEFCARHGIDRPWLKLDAEGAELKVLTDLLTSASVESVAGFVELHSNHDGVSREQYHELLAAHGYTTTRITTRTPGANAGYLFAPAGNEFW